VFNKSVLKRKLGSKREGVVGGWRRMHNEELCNLYASPNIIRVIVKEDKIQRTLAYMQEMRNTKFWSGNLKGRDHSQNLGIDEG
jgi:hypothetical protein